MKVPSLQNITSFITMLALLAITVFVVDMDRWSAFSGLKTSNILISMVIALFIQTISGCMYYYTRRQFGVSMQKKDVFLLPPVMGLWSFIVPIQGSLIFTIIFFKKKYNMAVTESLSINIFLYLLTLVFTGLVGLYIAVINNNLFSTYSLVCLLLLAGPFFVIFQKTNVTHKRTLDSRILQMIKSFIVSTVNNTQSLLSNHSLLVKIGILKSIHMLVSMLWFYYISFALEMDLLFSEVALISLVASASYIIKITPGNLGTTQLTTGAFMVFAGYSPDQAIMITLFSATTVMLLNVTLGFFGNYYYFKTINIIGMKKAYNTK